MKLVKSIKSKLKAFTTSDMGSIGVIFALGAIPLFAAVGAAIDFGRHTEAQAEIQSALDVAALTGAAATGISTKEREAIAKKAFLANINPALAAQSGLDFSLKVKDAHLVANAAYDMPTSFMNLVGISTSHITASNEVNLTSDKKVEIAFALDYSGSMGQGVPGGTKYTIMRKAAQKLLKDLDGMGKDAAKVAVVPYSDQVYITIPSKMVLGAKGDTWTGCTVDRKYPYNQTADVPDANPDSKWGQKAARVNDCGQYKTHNLLAVPMTSDLKTVSSRIGSMTPLGATHTSAAVAFAYHMLTPSNPFAHVADYSDEGVEKFMVILTDGNQTQDAFGPKGKVSPAEGDKNLEALCQAANRKGIHVVTVAFDVTDAGDGNTDRTVDTKTRLKNCATDPSKDFFEANNAEDVSNAFNSILNQVAQNIFLSK